MSQPPNGSAPPDPDTPAPAALSAVPTQPAPPGPATAPARPAAPLLPGPSHGSGPDPSHGSGPDPGGVPPRRTALAEGVERLRAAAVTEPGRLRALGALLALLVVAFGAVTAWQAAERTAAAGDVLHRSQPLSSEAAGIYRSLAAANTAASTGFLAGGQETKDSRDRYEQGIRTAADSLVTAAANSEPGSASAATVADLNRLLPRYKGLVERARVYNRQGYPVGGAYLRYANDLMQEDMLPAAEALYTSENGRLSDDYADAKRPPWAALVLGLLALAALAWAQYRTYRRTHRVLNRGLVAATAATAAALLWLVAGHGVARSQLSASHDHGVRSLTVLHEARLASLKARGNENLTLVARGAETVTVGGEREDAYDAEYRTEMAALGADLAEARRLADDAAGERPVAAAAGDAARWRERHRAARAEDENGNYRQALEKVIGGRGATAESFDGVDTALATALAHEEREFARAAGAGLDALAGLPQGAGTLAALGAAGAVLGIGRRLSEYR
ncbi:hypothetical protein J2S47_002314 [Streptomyces griseoviridis]|uniref:Secreted protein n=1 Tax=Streptomyces griseoviridis TaxID=45398 RepID=A0ABT9LDL3_STRGD|nr:hypothetical protein [Streptomyces griseoviridis]GGS71904.1 hypothetical protein GCM10010240_00770 [Streptomyces griseoviridis]